jgi:hypothetical protein
MGPHSPTCCVCTGYGTVCPSALLLGAKLEQLSSPITPHTPYPPSPSIPVQAGKTPLDIALEQQQPAAASMLAEALSGRGSTGNTPTGGWEECLGRGSGTAAGTNKWVGGVFGEGERDSRWFQQVGGRSVWGGGAGQPLAPSVHIDSCQERGSRLIGRTEVSRILDGECASGRYLLP